MTVAYENSVLTCTPSQEEIDFLDRLTAALGTTPIKNLLEAYITTQAQELTAQDFQQVQAKFLAADAATQRRIIEAVLAELAS